MDALVETRLLSADLTDPGIGTKLVRLRHLKFTICMATEFSWRKRRHIRSLTFEYTFALGNEVWYVSMICEYRYIAYSLFVHVGQSKSFQAAKAPRVLEKHNFSRRFVDRPETPCTPTVQEKWGYDRAGYEISMDRL